MNENEILPLLQSLAQLDVDAFFAYGRAIDAIDVPNVRRRLMAFRRDHKRHYDDLSGEIGRLGGTSPDFARDAKGLAIEGYTAIRSGIGNIGALRAMKTNEGLTNARYEAALRQELPPRIAGLIERNRNDERRHLAYIERVLETRRGELASGLLERPSFLLGAAALLAGIGAVYVAREWKVGRSVGKKIGRHAGRSRPETEQTGELHFRAAGMDPHHAKRVLRDEDEEEIREQGLTDIGDVAQVQMPGTPPNLRVNPRDALEEPRRRAFEEALKNRKDR
jgi:hypothetical protein